MSVDEPTTLSTSPVRIVAALILVAALVRFSMRSPSVLTAPIASSVVVATKTFDPDAFVGVAAGEDGLPGIAGVDDGANGVVDDPAELGATGSDDRVLVLTADQYRDQPALIPLVLARGGWIVADRADDVSRQPMRTFFVATSRNGAWEWMTEKKSREQVAGDREQD